MHSHSHRGGRWRRFNRKYGLHLFIGILLIGILGIVFLLMWALSNPSWRSL